MPQKFERLIPLDDIEASGDAFDTVVKELPEELLNSLTEAKRKVLQGDPAGNWRLPENLRRIVLRQLAAAHCFRVVSNRLSEYELANGYLPNIDPIRVFISAVEGGELLIEDVSVSRLGEVYATYEKAERNLAEKLLNDQLEVERLKVLGTLNEALLSQMSPGVRSALTHPLDGRSYDRDRQVLRSAIGQATRLEGISRRSLKSLQKALEDFLENFSHVIPQMSPSAQGELVDLCSEGVTDANRLQATRLVEFIDELKRDEKTALGMVPGLVAKRNALKKTYPKGSEYIEEGSWNHSLLFGDMEAAIRRSLSHHQQDPGGNREIDTLTKAAENIVKQMDGPLARWLKERHDHYTEQAESKSKGLRR